MQLPKLTPLQSRLLASVVATCILLVIWSGFQPQYFVYAAELESAAAVDDDDDGIYNQFGQAIAPVDAPIIETQRRETERPQHFGFSGTEEEEEDLNYSPDFAYFDRSLIGRAPQGVVSLTNNVKREEDSDPGVVRYFVLEKSQLKMRRSVEEETASSSPLDARGSENMSGKGVEEEEDADNEEGDEEALEKRQNKNVQQVWISANACRQPLPTTQIITEANSPQLKLYVSTSTRNQKPGPDSTNGLVANPIEFQGGYANFTLQTNSDIFIGISAPNLTDGWAGSWKFEIAASIDGYYHSYHDDETFLFMVDTDSESALFITPNITSSNSSTAIDYWRKMNPLPFIMYAQVNDKWGAMTGLERSFCALQNSIDQSTSITVTRNVTTKFAGNALGKAQFHVQGLKNGTAYNGFMAINGTTAGLEIPGKGIVRNGGTVWKQFNWTTKADDSCQVIFDLPFCSDIAYAVPSSLTFKTDTAKLIEKYDNLAKDYYKNFTNSLDQVACNTTGTAQYSLARTCDDCRHDYKTWLCSVLMPRCEDFSANDSWLQPRNIGIPFLNGSLPFASNTSAEFNITTRDRFAFKQSRNPMIDLEIKPGPYKELLPCEDLCFDIVRSCPAQLGFTCPNEPARSLTYGRKSEDKLTCNFPGAVVNLNVLRAGVGAKVVEIVLVVVVAVVVGGFLWI